MALIGTAIFKKSFQTKVFVWIFDLGGKIWGSGQNSECSRGKQCRVVGRPHCKHV